MRFYTQAVENQMMDDAALMEGVNGTQVEQSERPDLDDDQVTQIEGLLSLAELQFSQVTDESSAEELAYVLSQGPNNVVELADTVLQIDPGYEAAILTKQRAFEMYLDRARQFEDNDQYADALTLTRRAGEVVPNSPTVLRLQRRICDSDPEACAAQ
jgi:hypothetical protein